VHDPLTCGRWRRTFSICSGVIWWYAAAAVPGDDVLAGSAARAARFSSGTTDVVGRQGLDVWIAFDEVQHVTTAFTSAVVLT
jgi:hypothetical protein